MQRAQGPRRPAARGEGLGGTEAGACCAGPNETAACADGYTVVAGDAPCVFTCCEGAVDNLTTAADVDRAGAVCWEAHANEGRRPVEWGDCCESECGLFVAGPVGRDYDDAVAYCSRIGAEIATIYSATENELARQACGGSPCWIGLEEVGGDASTPKASQTWRWMDGSTASYTNWMPSEPENHNGKTRGTHILMMACGTTRPTTIEAPLPHRRRHLRVSDGLPCREACSQNFCEAHWGEHWGRSRTARSGSARRPAGRKRTRRRRALRGRHPAPTASTTRAAG